MHACVYLPDSVRQQWLGSLTQVEILAISNEEGLPVENPPHVQLATKSGGILSDRQRAYCKLYPLLKGHAGS